MKALKRKSAHELLLIGRQYRDAIPEQFQELAKERAFRQRFYWETDVKGFHGESVLKPKERTVVNAAQLRVV